MVKKMQFRGCVLAVDIDRTRAAYSQMDYYMSGVECDCVDCKNFAAAMPRVFSAHVIKWFDEIGIDYRKPAEICHFNREESGQHLYGGWYHCIGELEGTLEGQVELDASFAVWFHRDCACVPPPFTGQNLVQVEISVTCPWVIDVPEID